MGNVGKLIKWITDQLSSLVAMGEKLPGQAGKWARDVSGVLEELGEKVNEKLQFDEEGVVEGIDAIRGAADEAFKEFEKLANQELPSETVAKIVAEWQKVSREEATAAANAKNYNQAVEESETAVESLAGLVNAKTSEMERAFQRWGDAFTNAMTDMVTKGEFDFKRLAESIINDLIRIAIQANLTDQIMRSFGFDNFGSSSSGGGSRSTGGPVERGTTYMVGEDGPKLFTASNSGNIIPNNKLGSGSNTTVNVYTQPGETAEVNTHSSPDGDIIEVFMKQVDSRINEQVSRGQGLARTLEGRYGLTRKAL